MPHILSKNFTFFQSVKQIPQSHWNSVVPKNSVYLSLPYLEALEKPLAETVKLIYVLEYDAERLPILAGMFQIATFIYKKAAQQNLFIKLFQDCRNEDNSFSIQGLVCGNVFATGEFGFAHSKNISKKRAFEIMATAAKKIKNDKRWEDEFSVILFKEFWHNSFLQAEVLEDYKYRPFQAEVNMVLSINSLWNTFSDYLDSMKAKYRTKAKSAYKKSETLSLRSLSSVEITKHLNRIQQLFTNVLDKSEYRYGENYPATFSALKKNLGDIFICKGVFLEDELIAFSTAFVNANTLEANYVGLDYKYNMQYAVYERLLYDYVEQAIILNVSQLHLGRTSELIKSAVGALPVEMTLFARHISKIKNVLLKPLFDNIKPNEFELRRPFQEKNSERMITGKN